MQCLEPQRFGSGAQWKPCGVFQAHQSLIPANLALTGGCSRRSWECCGRQGAAVGSPIAKSSLAGQAGMGLCLRHPPNPQLQRWLCIKCIVLPAPSFPIPNPGRVLGSRIPVFGEEGKGKSSLLLLLFKAAPGHSFGGRIHHCRALAAAASPGSAFAAIGLFASLGLWFVSIPDPALILIPVPCPDPALWRRQGGNSPALLGGECLIWEATASPCARQRSVALESACSHRTRCFPALAEPEL